VGTVAVVFALVGSSVLFYFLNNWQLPVAAYTRPSCSANGKDILREKFTAVIVNGADIQACYCAPEELHDCSNCCILVCGISGHWWRNESPVFLWILIKPGCEAIIIISFFKPGILMKSTVCFISIGIHGSSWINYRLYAAQGKTAIPAEKTSGIRYKIMTAVGADFINNECARNHDNLLYIYICILYICIVNIQVFFSNGLIFFTNANSPLFMIFEWIISKYVGSQGLREEFLGIRENKLYLLHRV